MGFYGNITNTSNTTFQFDRIYPNRLAMDANANNDGIFIGRYVLVEYQEDAAYPNGFRPENAGNERFYFYASPNAELTTRIQCLGPKQGQPENLPSEEDIEKVPYQDGVYEGEIIQHQTDNGEIEFYQCESRAIGDAIFKKIDKPTSSSQYIQNFAIDEAHYSSNSKGFKGYDSTVWVKSSVEQNGKLITKYVNIADLNSVVPTFDIAADAPTMEPITPHFDADSTNVYYKLHAQTPYGFRVKKQENELFSDEKTKHYTVQYHKDTGVTISTPIQVGADIYYNKEAFRAKPEKDEDGNIIPVVKKDIITVNEIKLQPSGYSENYDNKYSHKTTGDSDLIGDIQEFSLHLPAIGNMMSDAWDIIHGPNRDDAQTDENSSLQGRLDSFKAMEGNAIPIKRNPDGTFVGTRINGNNFREVADNAILKENLSISFDEDDAWIRTEIDTIELDNKNKLSGISIHHTFHEDNTNYDFLTNKNIDKVESENESDKIKLYTPKVDAAGHVVGKSIETVTLPYGYKTIKVTNTDNEAVLNAAQVINPDGQIADNTQDELKLSASNRWVKLDNNTEDTIKFGHQVNIIEEKDKDLTDLNDGTDIITIQDTIYDEAGHVTANQKHTYILPYGFKYIDVTNDGEEEIAAPASTVGTQTADNTQDTLKLTTSNKWILLDGSTEDAVQFGHLLKTVPTTTSAQSLSDEISQAVTFKVYDDSFDEAGHHNGRDIKTITMPFGYGKIKGDTGSTEATATFDELTIKSDDAWIATSIPANTSDIVNIIHTGPVATQAKNDTNKTPRFGETFDIEDWVFDEKGHQANLSIHKVTIPEGDLTDVAFNGADVITQLAFDKPTGHLTSTRTNVGALKLTGYELPTQITNNGILSANATVNDNFGRLEFRLNKEVSDRKNAITKEVSDRNIAISSAISAIVDKDDDGTINKLAEVIEWINNNPSTATQMQKAIQDNTKAISDEVILARSEEEKIADALTTEIGRATAAEQELQNQIDALGSAAQKNVEYFATSAQGAKADATAATIATYGDIVIYKAEDFVSKEEYDALLSDYNELKELVEKLNNQINPPQEEPEGDGEE